ncbi:hypothetical protein C3486_28700 [Streptomyces sp. Ru73]|uniref:PH domain-containing protein n=1 Tax=Streptomyces sp. Ru73 TaxID=2080748 RepID=UPI000CDD6FA9|nr:PH domain-containing protein [Streptomyces sp. Ru73]POX37394.1 hypothetical protein C3486_28700 [Streptomyces sp. Ru73]
MPLPFLTADRDLDGDAPDPAPLPYDERDHWRRPYRPGPWRVGAAAVFLLLASFVLLSALIIGLAGAPVGAVVCLAVALVLIGFALRLLRAGVWVSAAGLRQVRLVRTTTLPWSAVTSVRTVQQPVRWLGLPRTVQGQALMIGAPEDGEPRLLFTDHGGDFLTRAGAFNRAADTVAAWAAEHRG